MTNHRELIDKQREGRLAAYQASPGDIKEHYEIEETVRAGDHSQVLELVQNGADAILEADGFDGADSRVNRIEVLVSNHCLYVANTGAKLSDEGIGALL